MNSLKTLKELGAEELSAERASQVVGGMLNACVPTGCDCQPIDERSGYSLGCTILEKIQTGAQASGLGARES